MSSNISLRTALLSLISFCFAHVARGQAPTNTLGFISIDCGSPPSSTYVDAITSLPYVSDEEFVDTGVSHDVSSMYADPKLPRLYHNLRSFPAGARNCYTVRSLTPNTKYLVRASFLHGNYDGLGTGGLAVFDLHLGVNLWQTVNVTSVSSTFRVEIITVVPDDYVQVCLVGKKGLGTPFISGLELRPLADKLYTQVANASMSMALKGRNNLGPDDASLIIRYPDDPHDRIWSVMANPPLSWIPTNTTEAVRNIAGDQFEAPSAVMQTAVTVEDGSSVQVYFEADDLNNALVYFVALHISELRALSSSEARICEIYLNDILWYNETYYPYYLYADSLSAKVTGSAKYIYRIEPTKNSTLPPILNAVEVYRMVPTAERATDGGDVSAIMAVKAKYQIKKNWMGDPCGPKLYLWDGVSCNYSTSSPPKIISLNLSASGLTGEISSVFGNLTTLQNLDLSLNNLTGNIPEFLAQLPSLSVLDLTGNKFTGVPESLLERSKGGSLTLRLDGNINGINNGQPQGTKRNRSTAVIVSVVVVVIFVLVVGVIVTMWLCRSGTENDSSVRPLNGSNSKEENKDDVPLQFDTRQFSYKELKTITNSFEKSIGKGGFGVVYLGYLEDRTPVAVKTRSESSSQGINEFLGEALHLIRVHHRNLVNLVGHCKDGQHAALVYEYMSEGTLQERLREKSPDFVPLSWRQRLRILLDSAQGLEYLHKACKPPLIHRDVKTANILLNGSNLEAKIADFGLSKAFNNDLQSHVSTRVVGTPGYLDPEYYTSFQLSEKSDVYSFGIVLLEVVTGQPPILPESVHIVQWARQRLAKGDIESVVDSNMQGRYDLNSVWKVADLALRCTEQASRERPAMVDVVIQLKESLELEEGCEKVQSSYAGSGMYMESGDAGSQSTYSVRVPSLVNGPAAR